MCVQVPCVYLLSPPSAVIRNTNKCTNSQLLTFYTYISKIDVHDHTFSISHWQVDRACWAHILLSSTAMTEACNFVTVLTRAGKSRKEIKSFVISAYGAKTLSVSQINRFRKSVKNCKTPLTVPLKRKEDEVEWQHWWWPSHHRC